MQPPTSSVQAEITIDEDTWIATFRPLPNPRLAVGESATWAIDYEFNPHETADRAFIAAISPHRIWTIVETDDGNGEVILSGFHWVNRRAYLITEMPWEEGKEYVIPYFVVEDDDLGS